MGGGKCPITPKTVKGKLPQFHNNYMITRYPNVFEFEPNTSQRHSDFDELRAAVMLL